MKDNVLDCIKSLKKQTFLPKEILLVLDNDPYLIQFFKSIVPVDVRVLSSKGFGLSNARNAGIKHSKGDIIAFIDDDAVADEDWLKHIINHYSEPTVAGVGGSVLPMWAKSISFKWFPQELNWIIGCSYKGQNNHREAIRNPIGCNMSYRRSIFQKVGYFRQDIGRLGKVLLDGEESEFSNRIRLLIPESKIMNEPTAVVFHKVNPKRMKLKYVWKRSFYQGYSKALINTLFKGQTFMLDVEQQYLKYLLTNSLRSRFVRFYDIRNFTQIIVLGSSSFFVLIGFAIGKVHKWLIKFG